MARGGDAGYKYPLPLLPKTLSIGSPKPVSFKAVFGVQPTVRWLAPPAFMSCLTPRDPAEWDVPAAGGRLPPSPPPSYQPIIAVPFTLKCSFQPAAGGCVPAPSSPSPLGPGLGGVRTGGCRSRAWLPRTQARQAHRTSLL